MSPLRWLWCGISVVVLAAGSYAGVAWWHIIDQRRILAAALPETPDLDDQPEPLRRRIKDGVERFGRGQNRTAALAELSRIYHANGFHVQADACYRALARLEPDEPRWSHRHAALLAGFGDAALALLLERRAVALAPDYAPARRRLGDLLLKSNQLDEAIAAYAAALARQPDDHYADLGLARCDFEQGHWEAARIRLERIVRETGYRLGYDLIVTVYEHLGLTTQATAIRGRQRASGSYRDPEDPWVDVLLDDCYDPYRLSMLAGSLVEAGDMAHAIHRLEQAIQLSPRNRTLHFQLASVLVANRAYAQAREQLQLCTTIDPEFPDAWAHLTNLYTTVGDRAAAESTLVEGLAHCPGSPGLHLMFARQLQTAGNLEAAITEFRTSIRLRPNEADAYIQLAHLLIRQDRLSEARIELNNALVAEPEHPSALTLLAIDAITRGDEAPARSIVRRVLSQPRTPADERTGVLEAFRTKFGHPSE